MKILIIGGSYFFGRWFLQYAKNENEITVVNRGNIKINLPSVTEIVADRHDTQAFCRLGNIDYDCIVDFCAYNEGDIRTIVDCIGKQGRRYIFVSTVDVYKKGTGREISEDAPLEDNAPTGPLGEYIRNKVVLEAELKECCRKSGMKFCSVRPSLLYGPANYAPREKLYFDMIKQSNSIYHPINATGYFQPLYIKDAARLLLDICREEDMEEAYNLCPTKTENYESFRKALHEISDIPFEDVEVTVEDVIKHNLPLPFPLTDAESEIYSGDKISKFGVKLTDLNTGLKESFSLA